VSRSLPWTWTATVHLVFDQQCRVDRRPDRIGDEPGFAQGSPGLLGEVRHHRRGEQQARADRRAAVGRGRRLFGGGGEFVDPRHSLVESQRLDVLGDPPRPPGGPCRASALSAPEAEAS
jgi:hypothetical protein